MDDRFAIQLARTEMREGYETSDIDRILNVYADDFGDMSASRPCFSGAEAKAVMRAQLQQMFVEFRVRSAPASIEILLFGDAALDYGWQELVLTPRTGGSSLNRRTRYMSWWRKQAGGCWRIALWIDNLDEQPMLAEEMIAQIQGNANPLAAPALDTATEIGGEPLEQTLAEP